MSNFIQFKTSSYCVGGRHCSGTNNMRGLSLQKELRC